MFICNVLLEVPLKPKGRPTTSPLFFTVAKYNYVPPLQLGDEIQITNWGIGDWSDEPLSFIAAVTRIVKEVIPGKPEDVFKLSFYVEMADKDELLRIAEIFKKLNPGKFEDELY